MKAFLEFVWAGLLNYWFEAAVSIVLILSGWLGGSLRARRHWRHREFTEQLNISLNMLKEGRLLIRTLAEHPLPQIFTNRAALGVLHRACQEATEDNPLLPLPVADRWAILNCILNAISEEFSLGYIRQDLGHPVITATYLICLTRERDAALRTQKLRAMVIRKDTLLALPAQEPVYEAPQHQIRFRTLQRLAVAYRQDPGQFLAIELSL